MENDHLNLVSFLTTHIVALGCVERTVGSRADANGGFGTPHFFTAFLLDIHDFQLLVTAGHVLRGIEDAQANRQFFQEWRIHDGLSSNSRFVDSIPFAFSLKRTAHWCTPDGADYGLIQLDSLTRAALKANGKKAIERVVWGKTHQGAYQRYFMLGLPTEFQKPTPILGGGIQMEVIPTLIRVERIDDPPADVVSDLPRFYGRIPQPIVNCAGEVLSDIDGMSGGPIFGFNKLDEGTKYWAVAIQSGWWRDRGIINACWLRPVAEEIGDMLREHFPNP